MTNVKAILENIVMPITFAGAEILSTLNLDDLVQHL